MKILKSRNDSNYLKNSQTDSNRTKQKPHCRFSWQPTSILDITSSYKLIWDDSSGCATLTQSSTIFMRTLKPRNDSNYFKNSQTDSNRTEHKPHCRFSWQPTSILDISSLYELILGRFKCPRDRDSELYNLMKTTEPKNNQNRPKIAKTESSISKQIFQNPRYQVLY